MFPERERARETEREAEKREGYMNIYMYEIGALVYTYKVFNLRVFIKE